MAKITEQEIRTLAYKLWLEQGCPVNNRPEDDWTESEWQLMTETGLNETESAQAQGEHADPASHSSYDPFKIGPRNDYQNKISFGGEDGKLRWIDNFRVLGTLDTDILRDFKKCCPKSYGNFLVVFKTGSVAENRNEIEANCFYLNNDDAAIYANESLCDALNGAINPFAPMHRTGPDYPPYISGATNATNVEILIPYKIVNDSGETIWCKSLEYNPASGLWRYDDCQAIKAYTTSDRVVLAMFERK